jgi:cell fate (sporulation/competence/biofilm development) regulator YlbF (YheA/YmcA/DUF963 family)
MAGKEKKYSMNGKYIKKKIDSKRNIIVEYEVLQKSLQILARTGYKITERKVRNASCNLDIYMARVQRTSMV